MSEAPAEAPRPAFASAAECLAWLEKNPATDNVHLQAMLLRQVNLLNHQALDAGARLDILETLRPKLHDVQEEFGRKFAGKPLPLTVPEQAAFDSCRALWHALATGYMRCAEACFAGDAAMKPKAALVLQRALAAMVAGQYETHRSGLTPTPEYWRTLHQLYAAAEQLNVTTQEVFDTTRLGKISGSVSAAYAEALLLAAAGLHEQSQRRIAWAARWTRRWAGKVRILASPPTLSTQAFPLCVDLGSDQPGGYMPLDVPGARWLETAELRRSIKKRLLMLEKGELPANLNLGDDCTQPACEQLLKHLYQRWCKGGAIRGFERRAASGPCRFVTGFEGIHYYLSGSKPFKAPGSPTNDMLRREREEIATFGRVATHHDENFSEQHGYAVEEWRLLENWHMVDASATGVRIERKSGGKLRIGHGQLVAACPGDAQSFLLGTVRWALAGDGLQAGVSLFPGQPVPVALRGAGPAAAGERFRQGFLLPAVAAVKQEASVVMAVGTYKLGKTLEVFTDQSRRLRLTRLIERGSDYERALYEPA